MHTGTVVAALALSLTLEGCADGSAEATSIRDIAQGGSQDGEVRHARGDFRCDGTFTGSFDNVIVPRNGTCTLYDATVRGNVKALRNARLTTRGNRIEGNIEGDEARAFSLSGDRVGGNIDLVETVASDAAREILICGQTLPNGNIQVKKSRTDRIIIGANTVDCPGNDVPKGNIQLEENVVPSGGVLHALGNRTGGNLQVFKNRGGGDKRIQANTVSQDLQCKENDSPFAGTPNSAGDSEDQCAG